MSDPVVKPWTPDPSAPRAPAKPAPAPVVHAPIPGGTITHLPKPVRTKLPPKARAWNVT